MANQPGKGKVSLGSGGSIATGFGLAVLVALIILVLARVFMGRISIEVGTA